MRGRAVLGGAAACGCLLVVLLLLNQAGTADVFLRAEVLDGSEMASLLGLAEAAAVRQGGWRRQRHKYFPTTDVSVLDDEMLRAWWTGKAAGSRDASPQERLLARSAELHGVPRGALVDRDVFVVKYSSAGSAGTRARAAAADSDGGTATGALGPIPASSQPPAQASLPLHQDSSHLTVVCALSPPNAYDGGGTFFWLANSTLVLQAGSCAFHPSRIFHAGQAVTGPGAERFVLVVFVDTLLGAGTWWRTWGHLAHCLRVSGEPQAQAEPAAHGRAGGPAHPNALPRLAGPAAPVTVCVSRLRMVAFLVQTSFSDLKQQAPAVFYATVSLLAVLLAAIAFIALSLLWDSYTHCTHLGASRQHAPCPILPQQPTHKMD